MDAAGLERILEQDLENIMEKARSGKPLNAREREMVEAHLSGLKKAAEPEAFALEPDGPAAALEGMTQKQLAEAWNVSLRTVKGWQKDGAPLTRPEKFEAWFVQVHAPRECPERYRNSAQRILAGAETAAAVAADKPAEKPREMIVIDEEAKGMLAMLERCRSSEARLGMEYMQAVEAGNEVRASFLFSQWTKMGEQLRALEKSAPETLEKCGIYVRKDEIQRELELLHRACLKAYRQQLRMCRPRLRATQTAEEWNHLADEIVDEVALMLVETEFREPLTLDAA